MNIISNLKKLPLSGLLAAALVLTPGLSFAEGGKQSNNKGRHNSHAYQQSNINYNRAQHKGNKREQGKRHYRKHEQRNNHHNEQRHRGGHQVVHNYNRHTHNRHDHGYSNHSHSNQYRRGFLNLRNIGVVFGLHTDNLDIYVRD